MGKMDDTGKALEKNINSNIEFDTSVLQEKNETYSSLTDTYGIDLFTDQYEEKIEKVHLPGGSTLRRSRPRSGNSPA